MSLSFVCRRYLYYPKNLVKCLNTSNLVDTILYYILKTDVSFNLDRCLSDYVVW